MQLLLCLSLIEDAPTRTKFEALYEAQRRAMLYTALRILHDQSMAEDVVHEAFLRILPQMQKISDPHCHKTRAFMVTIVRNLAINAYNKRKKGAGQPLFEGREGAQQPAASALGEENSVAAALRALPPLYVEAMTLRYVEELSDRDCAQLLGLSHAALRKRLERGRDLLRELLKERGISDV